MEITLEQVDKVKERTGVSYAEAKSALELTNGDVLGAIILLEEKQKEDYKSGIGAEKSTGGTCNNAETISELKVWLKDLINKGNISRIKVSKDGDTIVDVPVNAGIAAAVIAVIIPPILAFVVVAAVVTKVTIEITKADGSVEVVNKYISKAVNDAKEKASDIADVVKDKVSEVNVDAFKKYDNNTSTKESETNTFVYTVKFEEEEKGSN
ncbi:Uncharacterised protein [uncultured Clostridium sp.]|uniref:DUF4342 domain-containing protein n=1 Tax=uncultured Clostridium sp. TaxID=59620 RepID=UPI0008218154|nr:DUF4342 domain-containing protein [uncultured Clostridium sp.]SCJ97823.1 Uncharacterised protein [uncultured Clostridium sp.]